MALRENRASINKDQWIQDQPPEKTIRSEKSYSSKTVATTVRAPTENPPLPELPPEMYESYHKQQKSHKQLNQTNRWTTKKSFYFSPNFISLLFPLLLPLFYL